MVKYILVLGLVLVGVSIATPQVSAAGYCPNQPGGKCPDQGKAKQKGRSDYTAEERKKIMENALLICQKAYGAEARVYRFDYKKWRVTCSNGTR